MRSLRALIGARSAERIPITSHWEAWLDEDGAATGQAVNKAATLVAGSYGAKFSLLGTVVISGLDDTGEPAGLSPAQADPSAGGSGLHLRDVRLSKAPVQPPEVDQNVSTGRYP